MRVQYLVGLRPGLLVVEGSQVVGIRGLERLSDHCQ